MKSTLLSPTACKHPGTFANRGNMKNCLTQKNPKMCDPILVNSLENATPL